MGVLIMRPVILPYAAAAIHNLSKDDDGTFRDSSQFMADSDQ